MRRTGRLDRRRESQGHPDFTNQRSPFQLDLRTAGTEVRFDLYYRYQWHNEYDSSARLAGPVWVGPRFLAQTQTQRARDVCSPTEHWRVERGRREYAKMAWLSPMVVGLLLAGLVLQASAASRQEELKKVRTESGRKPAAGCLRSRSQRTTRRRKTR